MFGNQVGFKDIFSNKPGRHLLSRVPSESSDSAVMDACSSSQNYSQLPYSQLDFPDSQDLPLQHLSQSQNSSTDLPVKPQGNKMLQRYLSAAKGAVFRDSSQEKLRQEQIQQQQHSLSRLSYQQQLQQNQARARDRDERDLLNSILTCVKESSAEVKTAVGDIRKNLEQDSSSTKQQLVQCLETVQSGLNTYNEKLMAAVELKEEDRKEKCELREQLAAKDAKITELEGQLGEAKSKLSEHLLASLQECYAQHKTETLAEMQKQYKSQQQELRRHGQRLESVHKTMARDTRQLHKQITEDNQDAFKELGQKLEGIMNESTDSSRQEDALKEALEACLKELQRQHRDEIHSLLSTQLKELSRQEKNHYQDVVKQQQFQLRQLQATQQEQLHEAVKQQMEVQGHCLKEQEVKQMVEEMWESEKSKAETKQQEQQQQLQQQMEHRFEKELLELRLRHQKEVERMTSRQTHRVAQQQDRTEARFPADLVLSPVLPSWDHGDENEEEVTSPPVGQETFHKLGSVITIKPTDTDAAHKPSLVAPLAARGFVSPRPALAHGWTAQSLFSKHAPSPSPIATVLPQVQGAALSRNRPPPRTMGSNKPEAPLTLPVADNTSDASRPSTSKPAKKPRRKRAAGWGRKKPNKKSKPQAPIPKADSRLEGDNLSNHTEGNNIQRSFDQTRNIPEEPSGFARSLRAGKQLDWTKPAQNTETSSRDVYVFEDEPVTYDRSRRRPSSAKMPPKPNEGRTFGKSETKPQDLTWFEDWKPVFREKKTFSKNYFLESINLDDSDSSEDEDLEDEPDSSPSLSVTDALNRRKIKTERVTPLKGVHA